MDTMINVWTMVEHVRVSSGAAELAIFTAILYWFFTSSRVADMLEVVGERVGGWCSGGGRDTSSSLRQAVRARRRHNDVYTKLDADAAARTASLYRVKEGPVVPAPQPVSRPPAGLACARCAPISRDSWQDPKSTDTGSVINILNIGKQTFANGGVVSRYLCDLAQCCHLTSYDYKDFVPEVLKDKHFQQAVEDRTQEEIRKLNENNHVGGGEGDSASKYQVVKRRIEAKALKIVNDISSAMSNGVLKLVAWVCHKAIRRVARGGCGTRAACVERLRRANAAGLPLVFVPLHRSHFDYILVTFTLYLTGLRPPLVAAGNNMRIPFFGWFLRGCGAFFIRRNTEGSDGHSDSIYKSALRSYILNSLAANNNMEFFIEGGRTRTGKPQPPKAGILSVIMDAYLDGTIDDALLVPVTLNYDKLVDGNFVREQLGMPKQMETFWSALRGIWRTLNTNHGSIRVDFNQPISLKELVTSFQKYNYLKSPIERPLTPPNNNLSVNLDRQILYNHSHSSLYGADVSTDHKMMVEAIGRHLVYDAAQATALMCTNVVSYVLLTEQRHGCTLQQLHASVARRASRLRTAGRDLGYTADGAAATRHALEMLGRGLVRREGSAGSGSARPQPSVAASLELAYYANAVVAHYAPSAIIATALESILRQPNADQEVVYHTELIQSALQLCEVLSQEFILCPPCHRIEEKMLDAIDALVSDEVLLTIESNEGLEEQKWSRRFAKRLEEEDEDGERPDPTRHIKYRISQSADALAERRRLLLTIRPLVEAYSASCHCVIARVTEAGGFDGPMNELVQTTLQNLTDSFADNKMKYGEAVSTDAIRNCLRLLRQWGVLEMYSEGRQRKLRLCSPFADRQALDKVCSTIYRYNVDTPLLAD
ncbi:glycerol-3-phosphate acyltransferase 1, mitochondrial isoform X1 [Galleria mellonella]|uniref:Glycerol-3-phosphate acyltransferase 1, mitochondrial isoform X1 n=2 Tax=Galleria mellonella TaxID=7137 RepID=A0A6J1WQR6_GALME|nr:glycerol-3-phosphate acyltransferase 1, mitochondrial isoform X1 [Galleria mellonella]XP_052751229.1 glycerol-3-phosphate acyltransferase 1, mitochondrial isoform X1 [Galleria mellonella]XP_052751231.1 glycerol-3-phosphate acyltransferase 1, mitochondrial isoform X1 [Galleria mellonella]